MQRRTKLKQKISLDPRVARRISIQSTHGWPLIHFLDVVEVQAGPHVFGQTYMHLAYTSAIPLCSDRTEKIAGVRETQTNLQNNIARK